MRTFSSRDSGVGQVLVVADLDGTLFDGVGTPPSNLGQLFDALDDEEMLVVPATSRSPHNVRAVLGDLAVNRHAICSDGAITLRITAGVPEVIDEVLLSDMDATRILSVADEIASKARALLLLFSGSSSEFRIYLVRKRGQSPAMIQDLLHLVDDGRPFEAIDPADLRDVTSAHRMRAISCFGDRDEIHAGTALARARIPESASVYAYDETRALGIGRAWLDVAHRSAVKAAAVRHLCDALTPRRVIVCGNGVNDVEMLSLADLSICPRDATPEVRRIATIVSEQGGGAPFVDDLLGMLASGQMGVR